MDNYHIYEEIGRSKKGTSIVYKGRKKKTIEYLAVKCVEKDMMDKVLNEVQIMHKLSSSYTLKFHSWYETRNHIWLILEYCAGGDLLTMIQEDLRMPLVTIQTFGLDLLHGLQYLHSSGVLYCDLKPSNLLLDEYGTVKLCNFRLARRVPTASNASKASQLKRGSPCYMAPELYHQDGVHSYASDLWALGCVLFELATGRPPFVSNSFQQLVNSIMYETPKLPASFDSGDPARAQVFRELVEGLLHKNPQHRLGWNALLQHPFWVGGDVGMNRELGLPHTTELPCQPLFEAFAQEHYGDAIVAAPDILRLSTTALRNQQLHGDAKANESEAPHPGYRDNAKAGEIAESESSTAGSNAETDVRLANADTELDFEERAEEEVEEQALEGECPTRESLAEAEEDVQETYADEDADEPADEGEEQQDEERFSDLQRQVQGNTRHSDRASVVTARGEHPHLNYQAKQGQLRPESAPLGSTLSRQPGDGDPTRDVRTAPGYQPTLSSPMHTNAGERYETMPPPLAVRELLVHPSDCLVKPIISNPAIERMPVAAVDTSALPFPQHAARILTQMDQSELEGFLTQVYRALASASPAQEKLNVLAYVQSLASSAKVANILVNSSLVTLLVRMSQKHRHLPVRCQLALILGLLVRYATYIAPDTNSSIDGKGSRKSDGEAAEGDESMMAALTSLVKGTEKNSEKGTEKLRRRAVSSLGELLFYIATQKGFAKGEEAESAQVDLEDGAAPQWSVPASTMTALVRCLRPGEDAIVRHYTAKTVENILAQTGDTLLDADTDVGVVRCATRLRSAEVASYLVELVFRGAAKSGSSARRERDTDSRTGRPSKDDADSLELKLTAARALFNLLRCNLIVLASATDAAIKTVDADGRATTKAAELASDDVAAAFKPLHETRAAGAKAVAEGIADANPRIRQAFLNILNAVFYRYRPPKANARAASSQRVFRSLLVEQLGLVPSLLRLLEGGGMPVLQAKAMLSLHQIFRHKPSLLLKCVCLNGGDVGWRSDSSPRQRRGLQRQQSGAGASGAPSLMTSLTRATDAYSELADNHLRQCLGVLMAGLRGMVSTVVQGLAEQVQVQMGQHEPRQGRGYGQGQDQRRRKVSSLLSLFPAAAPALENGSLRQQLLLEGNLLPALCVLLQGRRLGILDRMEHEKQRHQDQTDRQESHGIDRQQDQDGQSAISHHLLHLVASLLHRSDVLSSHRAVILSAVLPAVGEQLTTAPAQAGITTADEEVRALCLQVLVESLVYYLHSQYAVDEDRQERQHTTDSNATGSNALTACICGSAGILPRAPALLLDHPPMPQLTCKLLRVAIHFDSVRFAPAVTETKGLVVALLTHLDTSTTPPDGSTVQVEAGGYGLSVHCVEMVLHIVEGRTVSTETMRQVKLADRVGRAFLCAVKQQASGCVVPLLKTVYDLLYLTSTTVHASAQQQQQQQHESAGEDSPREPCDRRTSAQAEDATVLVNQHAAFVGLVPALIKLLDYRTTVDPHANQGLVLSVQEGSSRCLLVLCQLYGPRFHQILFTGAVTDALLRYLAFVVQQPNEGVQMRLLRILRYALKEQSGDRTFYALAIRGHEELWKQLQLMTTSAGNTKGEGSQLHKLVVSIVRTVNDLKKKS